MLRRPKDSATQICMVLSAGTVSTNPVNRGRGRSSAREPGSAARETCCAIHAENGIRPHRLSSPRLRGVADLRGEREQAPGNALGTALGGLPAAISGRLEQRSPAWWSTGMVSFALELAGT